MMFSDPALATALEAMAVPGVGIGHRLISAGDEQALLPEERAAFADSILPVRRASGAARIVARKLLAPLGHAGAAIPKAAAGAPTWPPGIAGSMSHDSRVAVAAIGRRRDVAAIGVDVEPAEPLPADLLTMVATPQERTAIGTDLLQARLLFVAKEAVYKAVYPLDRVFLEHHDVRVSFTDRKAVVCNGRIVDLRFCVAAHLLALAFIPADASPR
jgi:4'-phosphopantetheinyl transferase EntD